MPNHPEKKEKSSPLAGAKNWFMNGMISRSRRKHGAQHNSLQTTQTEFTAGMKYIHDNIIGNHALSLGPYGERRMLYADYTASGRSLYMIENYLVKYVLSYYANVHTTTSFTSIQTSKFRDDAKSIIRTCVNATEDDAVIFTGSGTTAGIHKLIGILGLNHPEIAQESVIFMGPYEHHSNILPWKETGARIVRIHENSKGLLDEDHLKYELKQHSRESYKLKVQVAKISQ